MVSEAAARQSVSSERRLTRPAADGRVGGVRRIPRAGKRRADTDRSAEPSQPLDGPSAAQPLSIGTPAPFGGTQLQLQ